MNILEILSDEEWDCLATMIMENEKNMYSGRSQHIKHLSVMNI